MLSERTEPLKSYPTQPYPVKTRTACPYCIFPKRSNILEVAAKFQVPGCDDDLSTGSGAAQKEEIDVPGTWKSIFTQPQCLRHEPGPQQGITPPSRSFDPCCLGAGRSSVSPEHQAVEHLCSIVGSPSEIFTGTVEKITMPLILSRIRSNARSLTRRGTTLFWRRREQGSAQLHHPGVDICSIIIPSHPPEIERRPASSKNRRRTSRNLLGSLATTASTGACRGPGQADPAAIPSVLLETRAATAAAPLERRDYLGAAGRLEINVMHRAHDATHGRPPCTLLPPSTWLSAAERCLHAGHVREWAAREALASGMLCCRPISAHSMLRAHDGARSRCYGTKKNRRTGQRSDVRPLSTHQQAGQSSLADLINRTGKEKTVDQGLSCQCCHLWANEAALTALPIRPLHRLNLGKSINTTTRPTWHPLQRESACGGASRGALTAALLNSAQLPKPPKPQGPVAGRGEQLHLFTSAPLHLCTSAPLHLCISASLHLFTHPGCVARVRWGRYAQRQGEGDGEEDVPL
ncbi:hypothetical protein JHW43_006068 [Diplocarpon mali]|nr:hypothetical protein JHW43_006068 [Diplocarpon mali]